MAAGKDERGTSDRGEVQARITEIRRASFVASRRGFDRDQVHRFLGGVADWLEGLGLGDPDHGELRRELAWVGERTSEIIAQAEETARELREKAVAEAEQLRDEATEEAERVRSEVDEDARRSRLESSRLAEEMISAAESQAETLFEEAARRRQDLQTLIADLIERRDEILADGSRLAEELADLFASVSEEPEPEEPGPVGEELDDEDRRDDELGDAELGEAEELDAADYPRDQNTEEQPSSAQ